MRVVVVNDRASINGGATKVAIMTATALARRGIETHFFSGIGPIGPELRAEPRVSVTCLGAQPYMDRRNKVQGAIRGIWDRVAARRFGELLDRLDPADTVVHIHTFRDALSTSVAHLALARGFVTIYTAHDYTLGCPYRGFFDFRDRRICHLRGLSLPCLARRCNRGAYAKKLWFYASQWVFSKVARIPHRLSHVIFLSNLSENVLRPYIAASTRHSRIANPFDFQASPPRRVGPESPFLFVGALHSGKDPVTAARAAAQLGAPIVFVGEGEEESAIRAANPAAEITGWLAPDDVAVRMRSARALLFPSIWYEAQPLTTMEAAACGLATLAADASAAVEQIEQLGAGEVFPAGDAPALAERMKRYLDDDFASSEGERARQAFNALRRTEDSYVDDVLGLYESELRRQEPKRL